MRYNCHNRRKYNLKAHIVLVSKYRKPILIGSVANDVKQNIFDICSSMQCKILAMETNIDHIHILLSYDVTAKLCDVIKSIKQQTTFYIWKKYKDFLSTYYWRHNVFWSDGYFACSIGDVSTATIKKYIDSQG